MTHPSFIPFFPQKSSFIHRRAALMAETTRKHEARMRLQANALQAWRRTLEHDRDTARKAVKRVIGQLLEKKVFHHTEIAQFYNQMMNGVAHPDDFGVNDSIGCIKRA